MQRCKICRCPDCRFFCAVDKYRYYLCHQCQTLFLHPLPAQKNLYYYYKKNFQYSAGYANIQRTKQIAKKIIQRLLNLNPQGKTLFDIGSGCGYFLEEAYKKRLEVVGIEPSKRLYQFTSTRLPAKQVKVFNADFESYYKNNKKKRFDFITLNHLIEHLKNPQDIVTKIFRLLNENGILYIETPNLNSHLFNVEQKNYTFLTPPEHLWIFSQKSIQHIISNIPSLEIINSLTYSYPEHLMGIIKAELKIKDQKSKIKKTINSLSNISNFQPPISNFITKIKKNLNYLIFDRVIAPTFTNLLNLGGYGSILELYIRKK